MLGRPVFDLVMGFYAVLGAGTWRYLWSRRTPIVASIHRLRVPKLDQTAELHLESSSDVGFV